MGRKRLLPGLTIKDGFTRHPFDVEHGVQTSGLVSGRHLGTGHAHDRHSTAYYGIAPSVFRELCARWRSTSLVAPSQDYTFIDFGAGMGRAMLLAARMPFREVIGVELNPVLAATAQKNIDKWNLSARARCPMRIVCQDAIEFEFPATPCLAYMFNPFREPVIKSLIRHMESSFARRPGQLDVLYANHEFADLFEKNQRWARLWAGPIPLSAEDDAADREILNNQPDGEYEASSEEPSSIFRLTGQHKEAKRL
ncbi:class I SAM-dependent methyltransferase [Acidicapsa ligni]|uniref:class I SAM-dependent methyltransferase n=1 Tax=Acidicapsa ligni TaxID=542300 RepID=UPI0021E00829|nr:class I SAM-dependent methyltransferase [Acidicapsa ligni]